MFLIFYSILIVFKSSLFTNDLSKNKQQKKYRMERISEIIVKLVIKYKLELVKKEILKAPRGTFTNFLLLFNDLTEELQKTSNRDSMKINYIIV